MDEEETRRASDREEIKSWFALYLEGSASLDSYPVEAWERLYLGHREEVRFPTPDEIYIASRRAARLLRRNITQQVELAQAINQGDLVGYIQFWYGDKVNEQDNGSKVTWQTAKQGQFGVIGEVEGRLVIDEVELIPEAVWEQTRQTRSGSQVACNHSEF